MLVQSHPWISAWMGKSLGLMMGSQKVRLPEIGIQVYPTFATDGHGAGWLSIVFFFPKVRKKQPDGVYGSLQVSMDFSPWED